MKKAPNPKIFLLLAIGALLLGGGACFMAYNSLSSAKAELKKLQADSKDERALRRMLTDSQASLQDSATKLQHLETNVQDYAYVPTMLTDLEKLGKSSGIDVTGVRPVPKTVAAKKDGDNGDAPKKKTYDELDIEVKGRGSYRSVMNFVDSLSKFPKIVAARTVELAPRNDPGAPSSLLNVTISLRAYVFATPQTPTRTAMAPGGSHEG